MSRWNRSSFNLSFSKKRPTEYHYIQTFENTREKECKRYDKNNDIIYEKNIALYMEMIKYLNKKNAIFRMNGPPDPPRVPSNYDLYIIHQNRNSLTNNKIQTMAILYLLQGGYKLVIDPEVELITKVMNKENHLFEPYMAIDIASSLNKNFAKEVAKYYKMMKQGGRLVSPELLSIEEKIDKFNKDGMIQYIDVCEDSTNTDDNKIISHDAVSTTLLNNPHNFGSVSDMVSGIYPKLSTTLVPTATPSAPPAEKKELSNEIPGSSVAISPPPPMNNGYADSQPPAYGFDNEGRRINIFIK